MSPVLGVLSKNREYHPTQELLTAIDKMADISGIFLSTQHVIPFIDGSRSDIYLGGQSLRSLAGIIPRIGFTQTAFGLICLRQFEIMGIPSTLSSQALHLVRNKFRCYQVLTHLPNLLLPTTAIIDSSGMLDKALQPFQFPIVIKIPSATQGVGTILASNQQSAREIIEALFLNFQFPIILQEYLTPPLFRRNGAIEDMRVLVVGDEVLGAMRRVAPQGQWRTNYAQGAQCEPTRLTSEEEELVSQIVTLTGIEIAGIDLYPTDAGLALLEVNACPGWKAFEQTYPQIKVAKKIIDYLLLKIRR
ncbi:MAG: RimK family alpha-L-glutamate ligase [Candidatus Thorarchaeota archaeon]